MGVSVENCFVFNVQGLTGRELFDLDASVFKDDEGAADMTISEKNEERKTNDGDKSTTNGDANVAAVEDVGDASLFLDMGDMLDDETFLVD